MNILLILFLAILLFAILLSLFTSVPVSRKIVTCKDLEEKDFKNFYLEIWQKTDKEKDLHRVFSKNLLEKFKTKKLEFLKPLFLIDVKIIKKETNKYTVEFLSRSSDSKIIRDKWILIKNKKEELFIEDIL